MSKASLATKALPAPAAKAVQLLARDIAIARTRRRIPQRLLAKRMMVSLDTVQRLERGNAGVSLGVVATALWALGLVDRLAGLASPDHDAVGNSEDRRRLPRGGPVRQVQPRLLSKDRPGAHSDDVCARLPSEGPVPAGRLVLVEDGRKSHATFQIWRAGHS